MKPTDSVVLRLGEDYDARNYVIGDIHGHFSAVDTILDSLQSRGKFDPAKDRLICTGDLVDRGPGSHKVLEFLERPYVYSVMGNHEYYVSGLYTNRVSPERALWARTHGMGWFLDLPRSRQKDYAKVLSKLPFAIEVPTISGLVAVVHAECPTVSWTLTRERLLKRHGSGLYLHTAEKLLHSRQRFRVRDDSFIEDIRAVVVGHSTVKEHLVLGNTYYVDTGGWTGKGAFTILDLETLRPVQLGEQHEVL